MDGIGLVGSPSLLVFKATIKYNHMKTATVQLESASAYSQSRLYTKLEVPPLEKESAGDYDMRNWRHHQHYDKDGNVFIPPMALKNCLMEAAQYLGEKVPGKRNATWTRHFTAGVLVTDPVFIFSPTGKAVKNDDADGVQMGANGSYRIVNQLITTCETFPCHADGKRGSGTRVMRTFPVIREWKAEAKFFVLDESITRDVFLHHLEEAGKFIGVGRFRPRNGGFYGRFFVGDLKWE